MCVRVSVGMVIKFYGNLEKQKAKKKKKSIQNKKHEIKVLVTNFYDFLWKLTRRILSSLLAVFLVLDVRVRENNTFIFIEDIKEIHKYAYIYV